MGLKPAKSKHINTLILYHFNTGEKNVDRKTF